MQFMERINQEHFEGALSSAVMDQMEALNDERPRFSRGSSGWHGK